MNSLITTLLLLFFCYSPLQCDVSLSLNGSVIVGRKLYTVFGKRPYAAFCNVRYAEPPVGDLRFKEFIYDEIVLYDYLNRNAVAGVVRITINNFQPPTERVFRINNIVHDFSQPAHETCATSLNEDCLKLSIYMPIKSPNTTHFPVLVWTHENSNFHGPDFFIDEDIMVVSVSYRISAFGFLHTGDNFAAGNMGAKDVLMALKWIKYNINIFLGDFTRVTVAGAGEGSTIAASLVLSESAEDLFTRVIVLSGSALSPADYRPYNSEVEGKLYKRLTGSKRNIKRARFYEILKTASRAKLEFVSREIFDSSEVRDNQSLINSFGCTVETSTKQNFMLKPPLEVYKNKMCNKNVDVMFGFNSLECLSKLVGFVGNRKLLKWLNYNFQYLLPFEGKRTAYNTKRYNRIRKRIMAFYFPNGTIGERSLRRYAKYHSDQVVYPLLRQATLHCEASCNNVYLYRFGFKGAFNIGWKSSVPHLNWTGATAGDEICYLFRCKSVNDVYKSTETAVERLFITKLVRLMANYVKYGKPTPNYNNISSVLKWKPLQRGQRIKGMGLTSNLKMIYLPEERRMKFWDHLRNQFFSDNIRDEL